MNKKLTPLEALKEVREYLYGDVYAGVEKRLDLIENALKILEQLQIIIGAEKIEDLPKLALKTENAYYSSCYNLKEAEKKLKALEIIKEKKVDVNTLIFYLEKHNETGNIDYAFDSYNEYAKDSDKPQLTQEEYELLKEELKWNTLERKMEYMKF